MTLTAGQKLGSYEIVALLGVGGMGEVYRARDAKLKREVAIKVLPEAFAREPERVTRFQREAEVLASLNHRHIAAIYDLAEVEGARFLVLELVEGETLADRLKRGPIPTDEALRLAKQVAEALEAAHDKGIVHRDLKPPNVKITPDGDVKVLDFGLAKVRELGPGTLRSSDIPTMMPASSPGMILGTAPYMSPEQAKGNDTDRRTDVWAFGCLLYEMLTGRAAFAGETVSEIVAGVLKTEPDWQRLSSTPSRIQRLVRRCLQKNQDLRLHDMADARIEIYEVQTEPGGAEATDYRKSRRERLIWVSLLAIVTLIAAAAGIAVLRSATPPAEMRVEITTPPTADPISLAISPDGRTIAFVTTQGGQGRLLLRSLESVSPRPLPGTEGASFPFWSPDGRSLGFFADAKLKRIDVDGGFVQTLANARSPRGGAWNRDGVILFAEGAEGPLLRINSAGGKAVPATQLGQDGSHRFPQFLPDGRHFLFFSTNQPSGVLIGQLDSADTFRLLDANSTAVYVPSGRLLFVRGETLFAQDFDVRSFALKGNPYPITEHLTMSSSIAGFAALSVSAAGPIVYRSGPAGGFRQFVWRARSGAEIERIGQRMLGSIDPAMSSDARRVAVDQGASDDIWILELGRNVFSRFTSNPAFDNYPIWSPDATRIVFSSNRQGPHNLYLKSVDGAGSEELLLSSPNTLVSTDWSSDGRLILYMNRDQQSGSDIWALPLDGDKKPFPVVATNFEEANAQFSPDRRWIAYESNESGRDEVYVQPFPSLGRKWTISTNGGGQPRWRRDGKELFFVGLDQKLMAVHLQLGSDGQSIDAGLPVALFSTSIVPYTMEGSRTQYVVSPDGQRFLMANFVEEAAPPIILILNWRPGS